MQPAIDETIETPFQIIPVLQSIRRQQKTMMLTFFERWERHLLAHLEFVEQDWALLPGSTISPALTLTGHDQHGTVYTVHGRGGGSGGGPLGLHSKWRLQIEPVPFPQAEIAFDVHVHYNETARPDPSDVHRFMGHDVKPDRKEWTDPNPWPFTFTMPEYVDQRQIVESIAPAPPTMQRQHNYEPSPTIGLPLAIIPVMQSIERPDETLTFLAVERASESFRTTFNLRYYGRATFDFEIQCAVQDDRGTRYSVWPSSGGGQYREDGSDIHFSFEVVPAIDPEARKLYVAMEEPMLNRTQFIPPMRNPVFRNPLKMGDWTPDHWMFAVDLS